MFRPSMLSILVGAIVAISLLVFNAALSFHNTRQLNADARRVAHTYEVIGSLERLTTLLSDAETGQRGFIITGEDRYLAPYHEAAAGIDKQVDDLQKLTADNPKQQAHFPELRRRLDDRLTELNKNLALARDDGFQAAQASIRSDRGRQQMDAFRSVANEMIGQERGRLRERFEQSAQTYRTAQLSGGLSAATALAAVIGLLWLLERHLAQRRQATAVISEQAERLRVTLRCIGDAVMTTDVEGRVTNLNGVAEQLTGWSPADAKGKPLEEVFHIVNETSRRPVENPAMRALREGIIVGLANHTVLIAKDGSERPIDDSAAPIRSQQGEILGCVLVFRDISERKKAEAERQRLVTLAEQSTDFIGMCDLQGVPFYINRAGLETMGLASLEEARQKKVADFFFPEDQPRIMEQFFPEVQRQGSGEIEVRFRHFRTGQPMWMLYRVFALEEAGERVGFATVSRDITQRRELEDNLRQLAADLSEADRRKDEFLAMLAHELRNPLAPISNGLQLLCISPSNGAAAEEARTMMERQLTQLVRLVDDLLDVSRITRNTLELRKERVDLESVIHSAVETSRPLIEAEGHKLSVSVPSRPIMLHADFTRLAQVVSNLLNNAARYTPHGGEISLSVTPVDGEVIIAVRDNGIGIPPEMLPKIFDIFTQVDRSTARSQGGLGLGLTIVQRLVQMHGGQVSAHSDGSGRGSTFSVRLPVLASNDASPAIELTPQPARAGSRRILVVDDNRDAVLSLAALLRQAGHQTQTAFDGTTAVEAAEAFQPELVLLDIGLPKLNGHEVARKIRSAPWGKRMHLVALTGWGQEDDRQKSREAGFDAHMVKPVDHAALEQLLHELPAANA